MRPGNRDLEDTGLSLYISGNVLLDSLSLRSRSKIIPQLEIVQLKALQVLYPGLSGHLDYAYFPISAVISMLAAMANGDVVEAGTVGCEGLACFQAALGSARIHEQWICQIPGVAARIRATDLTALLRTDVEFTQLLLRYGQALITSLSQTIGCNSLHLLPERCAKWLLLTYDRVGGAPFELTQELLAVMLGVRRAGVSIAASTLAGAGYIRYARGRITILDRAGLESASCECYAVISAEFQRVLKAVPR